MSNGSFIRLKDIKIKILKNDKEQIHEILLLKNMLLNYFEQEQKEELLKLFGKRFAESIEEEIQR